MGVLSPDRQYSFEDAGYDLTVHQAAIAAAPFEPDYWNKTTHEGTVGTVTSCVEFQIHHHLGYVVDVAQE